MRTYKNFLQRESSIITISTNAGEVLLQEPSLVALYADTGKIISAGSEAQRERKLLEQNGSIIGSPLMASIVADFDISVQMFKYFAMKARLRTIFMKPKIAVRVPIEMTQVETQALMDVMFLAIPARSVLLNDESVFRPGSSSFPAKSHDYKFLIEISPPTN